jgi:transcriptional regulator with XRE-family HTH domain
MTTAPVNWKDSGVFDDLPDFPKLGNALRAWRICDERTLEDVARQAGVSKQILSLYERGEKLPSIQKTIQLANALDAPLLVWVQHRINDEIHLHNLNCTVILQSKTS